MCSFLVFLLSFLLSGEIRETSHMALPANLMSHLKNDPFLLSDPFMFSLSRSDFMFLPQVSVFPTLEKAVRNKSPPLSSQK